MSLGAPTSQLRLLLEDRFSHVSKEIENLFTESRHQARRELAEQLNQAVRRLRHCLEAEELVATLVDAAGAFAAGAALFRVEDGVARGERIRGVTEEIADRFVSVEVPLGNAAALAGAVESRDPVIAASTPSQVSQPLMDFFGHESEGRVSIYPIVVRDQVTALVYAWGTVNGPIVEMLSQIAAAVWIGIAVPPAPPVPKAAPLVQIAAGPAPEPPPKPTWESLSAEEQQVHFRAQRFARVQVAEMRLYQGEAVQSGRAKRDLYGELRKAIDQARKNFHESFYPHSSTMVDYLHLELVRTLANDDPELMGKDYPGPLA